MYIWYILRLPVCIYIYIELRFHLILFPQVWQGPLPCQTHPTTCWFKWGEMLGQKPDTSLARLGEAAGVCFPGQFQRHRWRISWMWLMHHGPKSCGWWNHKEVLVERCIMWMWRINEHVCDIMWCPLMPFSLFLASRGATFSNWDLDFATDFRFSQLDG